LVGGVSTGITAGLIKPLLILGAVVIAAAIALIVVRPKVRLG
jgi:hypothetical protein